MRVALLGKGGSGKSTLAGLLCAELAARGGNVVAFDADTVPGLGHVLGMPPSDEWFLAGAAVREGGGWRLDGTPAEIVDRCARPAGGGVRFLQIGNADATLQDFELYRARHPEKWSATMAFNTVCRVFDDEDGWVIVDLQGGTVNVAGGMVGTKGVALVVVEPFAKSLLTARRFAEMTGWPRGVRLAGVASKVASAADEAYAREELARVGLPLWASIPLDPAVRRAERAGQALVGLEGASPVRRAVSALADRLEEAASAATPSAAGARA